MHVLLLLLLWRLAQAWLLLICHWYGACTAHVLCAVLCCVLLGMFHASRLTCVYLRIRSCRRWVCTAGIEHPSSLSAVPAAVLFDTP